MFPGYALSTITRRLHPLYNNDPGHPRPFPMRRSRLVLRRVVAGHRLLIGIEFDHHVAGRRRAVLHGFTAPAAGQEPAAVTREGLWRAARVLGVLLRVGHVHVGDPIAFHAVLLISVNV